MAILPHITDQVDPAVGDKHFKAQAKWGGEDGIILAHLQTKFAKARKKRLSRSSSCTPASAAKSPAAYATPESKKRRRAELAETRSECGVCQ